MSLFMSTGGDFDTTIYLAQGLVAHYLLNNNADDSFGAYGGTPSSTVVFTGDAIKATGIDSADISITGLSNIKTISLWLDFNDFSNVNQIISSYGVNPPYTSMTSWGSGNTFRFYSYDTDFVDIATVDSLSTDTLYHVVITTDGSTVRTYLDGVAGAIVSSTHLFDIRGLLYSYTSGRGHDGLISNLRIYSDTKDQAFINILYAEGYYPKPLPLPTTVGLVAHYPLTGTAEDTTGNYDGTEHSLTYGDSNEFGSSVVTDGTASYVDATALPNFTSLTISFWIKINDVGVKRTIFTINDGTATNEANILFIQRTALQTLALSLGNTITEVYAGVETTETLVQGEYKHIVVSFSDITLGDYTSITSYMNNVQNTHTNTSAGGTRAIGQGNFVLGMLRYVNNIQFDNSNIRNLRLYSSVLTTQERTDIYNYEKNFRSIDIDDGLVAYYPLANNSLDNYHNEYDGADLNITYSGNSGVFNGISTSIELNSVKMPSIFTFSVWVYRESRNSGDVSEYLYDALTGRLIFGIARDANTPSDSLYIFDGSTTEIFNYALPYNVYKHILYTSDGNDVLLYIDGVYESTVTSNTVASGTNVNFMAAFDNTMNVHGKASKLRIYNKILTPEQIEVIYNTEKGDFI